MKALRCAIYTRKSSEEGLDQAFNSLHAQREACEAYILSQGGEGWKASPVIYDDGGFSGGSMDRPALKRLLAEVDAGQIDIVVVYKVDRLTRSLTDFARIVERFDNASASFVSVTQAFNTTTSMGRLTLNVLLSFAQFEREVTGERIRDKIAASKKKGMWMGGALPLGYDRPTDPQTRALVVNEAEAEKVRLLFNRYLEVRSVHKLVQWLSDERIASKSYSTLGGKARGGLPFGRGAVFHLLQNRIYIGDIVHKDQHHPGNHPGIIDLDVFERAQALLAENAVARRVRVARSASSPLKTLLFDAEGVPMTPTFSLGSNKRRYRYYVSTSVQNGVIAGNTEGVTRRITAGALETLLTERLTRVVPSIGDLNAAVDDGLLLRVDALPDSLAVKLRGLNLPRWNADPEACIEGLMRRCKTDERLWRDAEEPNVIRFSVAVSPRLSGGRTEYVGRDGKRPKRIAHRDRSLIAALRAAHESADRLRRQTELVGTINTYERNLVRLAFLAPDIQRSILDGLQPQGLTLRKLVRVDLPLAWTDQRVALGF